MKLSTEPYLKQLSRWPKTGRHILAQYNDHSIVVYQAYSPLIGNFAASEGYFGGAFKFSRMSWIKTNFLWMMYRSGWGTKPGQEVTLAIWLKRSAFEKILAESVPSQFKPELYSSQQQWQKAVKHSPVRLQWDPDHDPRGDKLQRKAIQLGLQGEYLRCYATEWIEEIEDISQFVEQQRHQLKGEYKELFTASETVYSIIDPELAHRLQLDDAPES